MIFVALLIKKVNKYANKNIKNLKNENSTL